MPSAGQLARCFIGQLRHRLEAWLLLAVASAAVLVAGGYFLFDMKQAFTGTTIATAAESKTSMLDNGVAVRLGTHTTLRVEFSDRRHRVRLLEGEAAFNVPANLRQPFMVSTDVANATTSAGAKFVVAIDTSVSFQVQEGVIDISAPGAGKNATVITLRRGMSYRISSSGIGSAVAKVMPVRAQSSPTRKS